MLKNAVLCKANKIVTSNVFARIVNNFSIKLANFIEEDRCSLNLQHMKPRGVSQL